MTNKAILVLETKVHDGIITEFRINDSTDVSLKEVLDEYINEKIPDNIEIYERGNDYVVCENAVYIAVYKEDVIMEH